jgi:Mrp family chromosome partitioning ATPase
VARAGGGASAEPSPFASLERTLDRTIERLAGGESTREARALLIEARRLRSVVANWRSIPPPSAVRDDMVERVLQLSTAVGAAPPESVDEPPAGVDEAPRISSSDAVESGRFDDPEAYPIDFEPRLYPLEGSTTKPAVAPRQKPLSTPPAAASAAALSRPAPAAAPAPAPAPAVTRSSPPPAAAPAVARERAAPQVEAPPARAEAAVEPPVPITYEYDDQPVPRTQIVAHAFKLAEPPDPLLVLLTEPYSPRADAYRAIRRKLLGGVNPRALGVTSANESEGKTVFALNLALTLRESARSRVLLVEANLRAPILGKMLGFLTPGCFISQLASHVDDAGAPWVVAEVLPKLHVMAIDPQIQREPLLDPVAFSTGLERLRQARYDCIIVDSPPVLGSVDCNVISDAVDGMILTALPMKSKRREMRRAVEQLEPALILGAVVLEV